MTRRLATDRRARASRRSSRSRARGGTSMVELMVGAGLLALFLGMLWQLFGGVQRAGRRSLDLADELQAAGSMVARLQTDLAGVRIPPGFTRGSSSLRVSEDGRQLQFRAFVDAGAFEEDPLASVGLTRIRYTLEPRDDGTLRLVRSEPPPPAEDAEVVTWETPLVDGRFRLEESNDRFLLSAELFLRGQRPPPEGPGGTPLRVVQRLNRPPNPSTMGLLGAALGGFPQQLFPDLPEPEEDPDLGDPLPPPQVIGVYRGSQ